MAPMSHPNSPTFLLSSHLKSMVSLTSTIKRDVPSLAQYSKERMLQKHYSKHSSIFSVFFPPTFDALDDAFYSASSYSNRISSSHHGFWQNF